MYVAVARVDWTDSDIQRVLKKYEKYIILHPRGEFTHFDKELWRTEAETAIRYIRDLGLISPIEMGTTGYGQNWAAIAQYGDDDAATDPLNNTMFLLQLYSEYAYDVPGTLDEVAAFPRPVIPDACLFTSDYGNTPNTYKEVWDGSYERFLSSFYRDWIGDGEGNSMTSSGTLDSLNDIGRYLVYDSPAALSNTIKKAYLQNASVN